MKKEALLYEKLANQAVHCYLCSHHCRIGEGKFGFCGVRQNIGGDLYTFAYGVLAAAHVDPVEKKPLYHFFPGTSSFSIATIGCNFRCGFCQNWEISQRSFRDNLPEAAQEFPPNRIIEEALASGSRSISYTYTEPTVFFEYALETAKLACKKGLKNILVTNGYMTEETLVMAAPYFDAANVDLKFFGESAYKKICGAALKPVLDSIRSMHSKGIWVEITTLVIPGENDSDEALSGIAQFIAGLDKNIPWHVSRFHPDYKFAGYNMTPEEVLKKAYDAGTRYGLRYIYAGNVQGWGNDTYCHNCCKLVLGRSGFHITENNMQAGRCSHCGAVIPGVF